MALVKEKDIPESEKEILILKILDMIQEKGCSFRQAEDILVTARVNLANYPVAKRLTFSELLDC